MAMESQTFFSAENRVAPLGIVPLAGARELSEKVEAHLVRWAKRARYGCGHVHHRKQLPAFLFRRQQGSYQVDRARL